MSHDLTLREDGTTEFFSAVTRGWHNLGQLSEKKLTAAEAIKEAKLDWEVEKVPVLHEVEGDYHQVPEQFVIRRKDNNRPLGVVSDKYQIIQNSETFAFADDIIGSGQAVWDTAGSIAGGKITFMQVELEGHLFLNSDPEDKTLKKVLFLNSHDGSKALMGMITPIRTVCQNTMNAALRNCSNQFKIRHRKNYASKKQEAQQILNLAIGYFDDLQIVMNQLAEEEVTSSYVEGFVSSLIPSAKEVTATRTENKRDDIVYLFSNGRGNKGRTKWDLFNAVTEYVDHHSVGRITTSRLYQSDVDSNIKNESRFERSILGSGANLKQKAMDLLLGVN